jgi:hypothetical protein
MEIRDLALTKKESGDVGTRRVKGKKYKNISTPLISKSHVQEELLDIEFSHSIVGQLPQTLKGKPANLRFPNIFLEKTAKYCPCARPIFHEKLHD